MLHRGLYNRRNCIKEPRCPEGQEPLDQSGKDLRTSSSNAAQLCQQSPLLVLSLSSYYFTSGFAYMSHAGLCALLG